MKLYLQIITSLIILSSCSNNNKFDETKKNEKLTQKIQQILGTEEVFEFDVERVKINLDSVSRLYNFHYKVTDSIHLIFTDSITTFSNPDKTILKEIYHGLDDKKPSITINFYRLNGQDSIVKYFTGGELNRIYISKYDSLNRITDYGWTEKPFYNDTLWGLTYKYRDSSTITGNMLIQDSYVRYSLKDEKEFQYMVLFYFDKKNRLIKEIRQGVWQDPRANIFNYSCNPTDSLTSRKVEIEGIVDNISYSKINDNSLCDKENSLDYFIPNFQNINLKIKSLIKENPELLNVHNCEQFHYVYSSSNKEIKIIFSDLTRSKSKVQCIISNKK